MNIELLKKLIRLANNNPNDHEANLAARKACKILAENDFALLSNTMEKLQEQYTVRNSQTRQPASTWTDVKRSQEAEFKSRSQSPPYNVYEDFRDFWRRARANPFYEKGPSPSEQEQARQYREGSWNPDTNFEEGDIRTLNCRVCKKLKDTQFVGLASEFICKECMGKASPKPDTQSKPHIDKRFLTCKTCGVGKLTAFVGLADAYECNNCQWTAYEKNKEKK